VIDVHTHVVPAGLPFGHDERFASIVQRGDVADVLVGGSLFRTVARAAWDPQARLAEMDASGVRVQALSVMPELFSYWAEPAVGAGFCAALNEAVAAMAAADRRRFVALGTVPLQDLDLAIRALDQVQALGMAGVQIGSNVNGVSAGAPAFLPFLQAAADAGLCVFVHAFHPPHWSCVADPPMAAAVNFPPEIGTCVAAFLANGAVERSPGLRLGASHGGGTFTMHLPRMAAFWGADSARVERCASPYDAARGLWYDTLTYEPGALRALVDLVGAERVMVGSDAPFFGERPGYVLDALADNEGIDGAVLDTIRTRSACSFLGLAEAPT